MHSQVICKHTFWHSTFELIFLGVLVILRHAWWVKFFPRPSWYYVQPTNQSKRTHIGHTVGVNTSICYNELFWLAPLDPQHLYRLLRGPAVLFFQSWYLLHGWKWIVYVQQSAHVCECTHTPQTIITCLGACYIEVYFSHIYSSDQQAVSNAYFRR